MSIVQRVAAPWRARIEQSLAQNKSLPYAKYVQLATVRLDGTPANRTVVFRDFLEGADDLTFVTDRRSNKVAEVAANPAAEVAWYFPNSREQYRLSGRLAVVASGHGEPGLAAARQAAWSRMSDSGRQQFVWPHPGLPRIPDREDEFLQPAPDGAGAAVDAFCLVVMSVQQVDLVELFTNKRTVFRRGGAGGGGGGPAAGDGRADGSCWTAVVVNP